MAGNQPSLWRNWLARSAVNRKVGGSSPPRDDLFFFFFFFFYSVLDSKTSENVLYCSNLCQYVGLCCPLNESIHGVLSETQVRHQNFVCTNMVIDITFY